MYHYTYMTVDDNSGKYYVGRHSTNNLFDKYKGSGKWVKCYSKERKTDLITYVLEFFDDPLSLKNGEQFLLNEHFQKPFCMNFNNKSEGFATGANNPTNLLTEEQKKIRSDNHWTKTPEGSKWVSDNNPSKMEHVKVMRSEKGKELWTQEEYRNNYIGDNHWTNQDSESARIFLERMTGENNPAKTPEVRAKLRESLKEIASKENFGFKDPKNQETALIGLKKRFSDRAEAGLPAFSEEHRKNLSKPKPIVICPHCNKAGGGNAMNYYHFDRCKLNPNK